MAKQGEDELAPYVLSNADVTGLRRLGESKGSGAYGAVYEVTVKGVLCIAKRLHDILVNEEVSQAEKASIRQQFRQECVLLSKLNHPNVVHFIGVHYGRDRSDLSLIMERLHTSLAKFLEPTEPKDARDIPFSVKVSILLDVVYGLHYMHSQFPPLLHRDLSANNVLLTATLQAKIADLGVSKLLDPQVYARTTAMHTKAPGSQNYMPPEALKETPVYGRKLDVFSFGHLALYTATQKFPQVYEPTITPAILAQGTIHIEKRRRALNQVGERHPLYGMMIRCMRDRPEERPTTTDLIWFLKDLSSRHPMSPDDLSHAFGEQTKAEELVAMSENLRAKDEELTSLREDLHHQRELAMRPQSFIAQKATGQEEEEPSWVVQREEIIITEREVGMGAWAFVRVAEFRGILVAAKCLHELIVTDYNRTLFRRQINMSAKIRHPNLLLFIGATYHGDLIILTELMSTTLRKVLEQGPPTVAQKLSIALDVAAAINYLHLVRPDPILHRDISSSNVLLEVRSDNNWRAKVSGFGSANLLRQVRSANPGSPAYAAPEAAQPAQQSPKMDIFSFGVLLVEIFTARFPDFSEREEQIRSIRNQRVKGIIRQCTTQDRNRRPTAASVLQQLSEL